MLKIVIPDVERFDQVNGTFITTKGQTVLLEHSLLSMSKWEAKWKKPFLSKDKKTREETIDYVKCMCTNQVYNENVFYNLSNKNIEDISKYIEDPMSATWFTDEKKKGGNGEVVTSELIYYWMVASNIPFECQKWHLNRLFNLIKICSIKNSPPKKKSKRQTLLDNWELNKKRREMLNSKG